MMRYKSRGFTLIEVLIALAIIAIACTAVIKAVNDSVMVSTRLLRDKGAFWVASNVLASVQNGIYPLPVNGGTYQGVSSMLNQSWDWQDSASGRGTPGSISKLTISVKLASQKKATYHLTGFVWVPLDRGGQYAS
jgi:general secretion pathway protein I